MIGALLTGLVAGIIGRLLVPDMWSELKRTELRGSSRYFSAWPAHCSAI